MGKDKVAVIGLGYVGLPLSIAFSKKYSVIGYDINSRRINELLAGSDSTLEVTADELIHSNVHFTTNVNDLKQANIYIVTVPTPIDDNRQPDLLPLINASKLLSRLLAKDDVVVYESTVYPGATEEICVPHLENGSGLKFNEDFYVGYSPERVNPGDKSKPIHKIKKVTSGSTKETAERVDKLYGSVIQAGTFKAASIKVAEASKVIENIQRDVNIALINELAIIFSYLKIDTHDVLDAASTKWNFVRLNPGLVGGHCIGVDPYYLLQKSLSVGYVPDMIRTAREINEGMSAYVASDLVKAMVLKGQKVKDSKVLVLGLTFKENCPDMRNSKVYDLCRSLKEYSLDIEVSDCWAQKENIDMEFPFISHNEIKKGYYDAVIIAVAHQQYIDNYQEIFEFVCNSGTVYDMKKVIKERERGQVRL